MTSLPDICGLVSQMQEILTQIHSTITSLDTAFHDAKLDELEKQRGDALQQLSAAFNAETQALQMKRRAEREAVAERRILEDEERERKRKEEDQQLALRDLEEDDAREAKLKSEAQRIEQETGELMMRVEEEARAAVTEGRQRLEALQEKRRVRLHILPSLSTIVDAYDICCL